MISDRAFILHTRKFKDSSEIIKLLTKLNGIVDVIAKGSRNPKSKFKGQLQSFIDTEVSFSGKSSLKTLIHAEQVGVVQACSYVNHVSMLYCNELILLLNLDQDACRLVYPYYKSTINQIIESKQISVILRNFEWQLCCIQGYQMELGDGIQSNDSIEFNPDNGFQKSHSKIACKAQFFNDFLNKKTLSSDAIKGVNQLMKNVVNHMVNGKTIQSRLLLK